MSIDNVKKRLVGKGILHSEESIQGRPTVIGYAKRFRWTWFATQLNTFIVATDFGDDTVRVQAIEDVLSEAFQYAKKNYRGWPRGFQSGLGVIGILLSSSIDAEAASYCTALKSGKKWAGFSVPVAVDTTSNETFVFQRNPMWGRIYYPYFKTMVEDLTEQRASK